MNESSSQSDLPQDHKDALEKKEDHGEERTSHRLIRNSISTYARLTGTFAIGLFLARFLGHEDNLGMAAYGLWGVILSSVGIVQVTQMTIRQSLVRELSQAFHTSDHETMSSRFTAAVVASLLMAIGLALVMLMLTPLILKYFKYPAEMYEQVKWAWISLSAYTGFVVAAVPYIVLFDVVGRVPAGNLVYFFDRVATLLAALTVFIVLRETWGTTHPFLAFIFLNYAYTIVVRILSAIAGYRACPLATIRLGQLRLANMKLLFSTGGHVMQQELSSSFFYQINQVFVNIFLGPTANALLLNVVLIMGYAKQIATGLVHGVEPLAAKFAGLKDGAKSHVGPFILTMTRIQTGILMPVMAVLGGMGQILINLWLGQSLEKQHYGANETMAYMMVIMLAGNAMFVTMQGALRIMLGAGFVHRYASRLLGMVVVQFVIALLTLKFLPVFIQNRGFSELFEQNVLLFTLAGEMSIAYLFAYGYYVPKLTCRIFDLKLRDMYIGAVMPGTLVAMVIVVFIVVYRLSMPLHAWNTLTIGIGLGVPVLIAMGLGWLFVLQSSERKRILELLHLTRSKLRRS